MVIRASTPTSSSFSLHNAGQTQLQIILSRYQKPLETGSVPQVLETLHLLIEKSLTIIFFVTVSAYDVLSKLAAYRRNHESVSSLVLASGPAQHSFLAEIEFQTLPACIGPAENRDSTCCIERTQQSGQISKERLVVLIWEIPQSKASTNKLLKYFAVKRKKRKKTPSQDENVTFLCVRCVRGEP